MDHRLARALVAPLLVSIAACASTPSPSGGAGPTPSSTSAPAAAPRPLFVLVTEDKAVTYGMDGSTPKVLATATLPEAPEQLAWRGDELVARMPGTDGAIVVVRGSEVTTVPQPAKAAWVWPKDYQVESDPDIARADYEELVDMAVVGDEIWKGRCAEAAWNEGPVCVGYVWLRLAPSGGETRGGLMQSDSDRPRDPKLAPVAAPAGYTLEEGETTLPDDVKSSFVRCRHGAEESVFPTNPPDTEDRYGQMVFNAGEARWLGSARPLWVAMGEVPAMDVRWGAFVFEGCSESPLAGGEVELAEGPDRWVATMRSWEESAAWKLFHDGVEVATVTGGRLMFFPSTPER